MSAHSRKAAHSSCAFMTCKIGKPKHLSPTRAIEHARRPWNSGLILRFWERISRQFPLEELPFWHCLHQSVPSVSVVQRESQLFQGMAQNWGPKMEPCQGFHGEPSITKQSPPLTSKKHCVHLLFAFWGQESPGVPVSHQQGKIPYLEESISHGFLLKPTWSFKTNLKVPFKGTHSISQVD